MGIQTRAELKNYCLRRLGYPTIDINVTDDQIEDRISDAIQYFLEFHDESSARILHKHHVTAEDVANQYIQVPEEVIFVHRILPITSMSGGLFATTGIFDPIYQMHVNDFLTFSSSGSSSLQYWYQYQVFQKTLQMEFSGAQQEIDFIRNENRLYIRVDWAAGDIKENNWIIIDGERILISQDEQEESPVTPYKIYNNMFLKEYTTELIREQWGYNLIKFDGIQMAGGVTFNGAKILDTATTNIIRLKEEARSIWEQPMSGIYLG